MRALFLICLLFVGLSATAQHEGPRHGKSKAQMERPDFTPEQISEIRVKELTLLLDLTEKQQEAIGALELEAAKEREQKRAEMKESKEKPTDEEKFERITEMLDKKIAFKNSMKSILDKDQFEKWEKSAMTRSKHKRNRKQKQIREGRK